MKKILFYFLLPLTVSEVFSSEQRIIVEAKFSYFLPSSQQFRDIYGAGGINYEISITAPVWKVVNVWAAADYFDKTGRSLKGNQTTYIQIIPATLGLKYIYPIDCFRVYGGAAMKYFHVHTVNNSSFVDHEINRNGLGGVAEVGGMFCYKHLVIDLFTNYSYKKFSSSDSHHSNVQTNSLQIGGWNFGGGVGYKF